MQNVAKSSPILLESIKLDAVFEFLLTEMKQTKYTTKTTKGEILKLLGLIVEKYPNAPDTIRYIDSVLSVCDATLKKNFDSKNEPELGPIAGAFSCIDRCLFEFEQKYRNNVDLWKFLLQTIKATNQSDIHRYAATNKALRLIKHHACLFQTLIGLNAKTTYDILWQCQTAAKESTKKHMDDALYGVLTEIAAFIVTQCEDLRREVGVVVRDSRRGKKNGREETNPGFTAAKEAVRYLFLQFLKTIQDGNGGDVTHAIISIGCLAPAAMECLEEGNDLNDILQTIISSGQHFLTEQDVKYDKSIEEKAIIRLNSNVARIKTLFLSAVISLIYSHSMVARTPVYLVEKVRTFIQEFAVDAIMGYSKVWPLTQRSIERTLCQCLHAFARLHVLSKQGQDDMTSSIPERKDGQYFVDYNMVSFFHGILRSIVSALCVRAVSRKLPEEELTSAMVTLSSITGEADDHLYNVYLPLWLELIEPRDKKIKALLIKNFNPNYKNTVSIPLFRETIEYCVSTLQKLDINYAFDENVLAIVPKNIADQDILLNLVSFMELLIQSIDEAGPYLLRWMPLLSEMLMDKSIEYPLISAFYRLLSCILAKLEVDVNHISEMGVSADPFEATVMECVQRIRRFLLRIQILSSTETMFRDELLDAVLKLTLTAPTCILTFSELTPSIHMALMNSLQVKACVDLISKHLFQHKDEVVDHVLPLLPLFDKYLKSFEDSKSSREESTVAAARSTKKGTSSSSSSLSKGDSELKVSILRLIGRLGSHSQRMIPAPLMSIQDSLSWTTDKRLTIELTVPILDGGASSNQSLKLSLDGLLPRLTVICASVSSADKQLATLAGECLQSIITFMIGSAASTYSMQKTSQYNQIYEKVYPVVIKLASSLDYVCQPVFETLLFQIIRWFAGQHQVHVDEVSSLIDALITSMCAVTTDNAEKSVSERGLVEYFIWAIKQSQRKDFAQSMVTVDLLLTKIMTLLNHPSPEKWNAAISLLRNLYIHFREESFLVSKYALRILFLLLQVQRQQSQASTEVQK